MTIFLLFAAGFLGGMLNSLAGGGSFIMFPALLFAGVPPVLANASNTYACMPGYVSGAIGYWRHIAAHRDKIFIYALLGLVGGYLGAELLMRVSDEQFAVIIPWLMLFAVITYVFGARINRFLASRSQGGRGAKAAGAIGLSLLLLAICVYGGFFNAGLGIILLAWLALAGFEDVHAMNGLKLLVSSVVAVVAVVRFAATGSIAWFEGSAALAGAVVGGFVAAYFAPLVPARVIRGFVIVYGVGLTAYFFWITYF
ncbi:sulfite exporter TauE/SafE family protein [Pelagibacterium limicola]|uniref:sulfite exporter TauE/SafE family protein n=1 Tax=Pelagibacterium limicola TaxID=2791022 RepID=UPI0018AFE3DB|nr:sulfite exporter TauE/SafE family protein [Pelagibacterium limicola]